MSPSKAKRERAPSRATNLSSSSRIASAESPTTMENSDDKAESSFSISMSSSRQVRQYEKDTLSNLNDRLAAYINRVRQLEHENELLNVRINEGDEVGGKECRDLAARYEAKIKQLYRQLDDAVNEKTRICTDSKATQAECDDLCTQIEKLKKKLKQLEKLRLRDNSLMQNFQAKLNSADNMKKQLKEENKNLIVENDDLKRQLEILGKHLHNEILANTALQNQNQLLKNDCKFLKRTHEAQLEEMNRKLEMERKTTIQEMERTYDSRMQEQLQSLHAEFDTRLNKSRRDIVEAYKNKLDEANEARQQMNQAKEELARLQLHIHEMEEVGGDSKSLIEGLNKKIAGLESELHSKLCFVRDDCDLRLNQRDQRIVELKKEVDCLLNKYRDLFDLKVQLDTELNVYQNLLESEESKLNVSQQKSSPAISPSASGDRSNISHSNHRHRRAIKRKRHITSDDSNIDTAKPYESISVSNCDIVIEEHDMNGKFIKLINNGKETISIGQWAIKSIATDKETVYKFHSKQTMRPGDTITVWSANNGEDRTPPSQLMMKNQQWPAGGRIITKLVDADGNEKATRESVSETKHEPSVGDDDPDPNHRCHLM